MPLLPNYNDWYWGGNLPSTNTQNNLAVPYKNLSDTPGYSNSALNIGIGYTYSNNPTLANFGWQQIAQNDPQGIYNPNNQVSGSANTGTNVDTITDQPSKWNWNTGLDVMNKAGKALGGNMGIALQGASAIGKGIQTFKKAKTDFAKGILDKQGMKAAKTNFAGSTMGIASDILSSFMPNKQEYNGKYGNITQTMDNMYDTASDIAMQINPLFGGIMKAGGFLSKGVNALGGGTDGMTKADSILGSSFLSLTPLGLINGFGGKKADTITKDNEAFAQVGSSYTGSDSTVNDALQRSGKKYGLFSRGAMAQANNLIAEARRQQNIISDISSDVQNQDNLRNSMTSIYNNARGLDLQGGYDQSAIRYGKKGMILEKTENILKDSYIELVSPDVIPEFKKGGSVNVIPEGALHARKHNMNMDGITKKGIPVVAETKQGEIEQQAEIEREEVILRLEVTQKLEKLEKKYYDEKTSQKEKDEYALEAGKLLTEELLYNTKDNANLL